MAICESVDHNVCYLEVGTCLGAAAHCQNSGPPSLISFDMYPWFYVTLFGDSAAHLVKPPLQNPAELRRFASSPVSIQFAAVFHAFGVQLCRKLTPGATAQPHRPIYMQPPPRSHISVPFALSRAIKVMLPPHHHSKGPQIAPQGLLPKYYLVAPSAECKGLVLFVLPLSSLNRIIFNCISAALHMTFHAGWRVTAMNNTQLVPQAAYKSKE